MAGPRKVRVFRDPKKSPNWYIEWRDREGRRHCESCGPHRRDAQQRASQIKAELQRQREDAKRNVEGGTVPFTREEAATAAVPNDCDRASLQLRGMLRYAQIEVPITISVELPTVLHTALRCLLRPANQT